MMSSLLSINEHRSVCIDCRMWGDSFGGIGRYVKELVSHLIKSNETWLFFLLRDSNYNEEDLLHFSNYDHVQIISIRGRMFSLLEQIMLFRKIPSCDIFWSPYINVPFLPIKAKCRVVTIHDVFHLANPHYYSLFHRLVSRVYYCFSVRLSDCIFTVSNFSKNEIGKFFDEAVAQKTRVVYNGCLISEELVIIENRPQSYILFVGNVKPHKNLVNALKAYQLLGDLALQFVIVGKKEGFITGDKLIDGLVARINKESERVVFTGKISDQELWQFYKGAKLLIVPSFYEGFGLPLVEGMAFNIPIVCSNIPVFKEIGADLLYYFDPHDVTNIKEGIETCLHDIGKGKFFKYKKWRSWRTAANEYQTEFSQLFLCKDF